MQIEDSSISIGIAIIVAVVMLFVVNMIRNRSLKGVRFAGAVEGTVGELTLARGSAVGTTTLTVHALRGDAERRVGLEVVSKAFATYNSMPITLTVAEAAELRDLLERASRGS